MTDKIKLHHSKIKRYNNALVCNGYDGSVVYKAFEYRPNSITVPMEIILNARIDKGNVIKLGKSTTYELYDISTDLPIDAVLEVDSKHDESGGFRISAKVRKPK